jgi:hypothetical protein
LEIQDDKLVLEAEIILADLFALIDLDQAAALAKQLKKGN